MTTPTPSDPLVSTGWMAEHLDAPDVQPIDIRGRVSTRMVEPGVQEATYAGCPEEYLLGHIPGAAFVDWTRDIIDPEDPVPVQLAPAERFAEAMAERGVNDDTLVVAYDHAGGQFATRLWWALMAYGHDRVVVLDGGWNRWREEDRPVETGTLHHPRGGFTPRPRADWRVEAEALAGQLDDPKVLRVDARGEGQYTGAIRRGPRGGRVPGAICLPREAFFGDTGFRPLEEIRATVAEAGLTDPERRVVAYCNGGVAATVVLFNLHRLGFRDLGNYDGSWNEWGAREDLPLETGSVASDPP